MRNDTSLSPLTAAYVRDRRELDIPNYRREDLGSVVRYTPLDSRADGIVCFTNLSERTLESEIFRHVEYFEQRGIGFEWKVYDFDVPTCLKEKLLDHGFKAGEAESVMVRKVAALPDSVVELQRYLNDEWLFNLGK